MGGHLDGRVAIVTGAAHGFGREHALLLAAEGAAVVANDLRPVDDVVAAILGAGGQAVGHRGDIADWEAASDLVDEAVDAFGHLDVLVNNAGGAASPEHDRPPTPLFADMTESAWDAVIRGNLSAMVAPTRAAVGHWTREAEAGRPVRASVVSTSSGGGLLGNPGQSGYGAAKAGIAALTIICAKELTPAGIRFNAIAPAGRTWADDADTPEARLMKAPDDPNAFDQWDPAHVSPLVAYLAMADCPFSGEVFNVWGGAVGHYAGWSIPEAIEETRRLTLDELIERLPPLVAKAAGRPDPGGTSYARLRAAFGAAQLAAAADTKA